MEIRGGVGEQNTVGVKNCPENCIAGRVAQIERSVVSQGVQSLEEMERQRSAGVAQFTGTKRKRPRLLGIQRPRFTTSSSATRSSFNRARLRQDNVWNFWGFDFMIGRRRLRNLRSTMATSRHL